MAEAARRERERTPLSRARVLTAAVALADDAGFGSVTMRSLATHLGVKPMALYHHVASKDEIVDGMVDAVFAQIELPEPDVSWRPAMRARAVSTRAVLTAHPWATPLMSSRSHPGPATLGHLDWVIGTLRRGGFTAAQIAHAYALLDSYIYGFALEEAGLPLDAASDVAQQVEAMVQQFTPAEYPHLHAFTVEHVLQPEYNFALEFEYGLDLILDGIERSLAIV